MRQLGKCDGCRQRKVKCDEKKPSCSGCRKGHRQCNYSYPNGRGFAFVMQDPSQMTRYGRSISTSTVHEPISAHSSDESLPPKSIAGSPHDLSGSRASDTPDLHLRGGMIALDGRGVFQTLAPIKLKSKSVSKKPEAYLRRRCREHLLRLQQESALKFHQPSSPDSKLTAMFVDILQSNAALDHPIFTLGNWVSSLPSRIGSSPVVTMAAEFFIHSCQVQQDRSHSKHVLALRTKSKALKELQLHVIASEQRPNFDLIIATKLHYAAEVLLEVTNMHYAIHRLGLIDLLKSGLVAGADEEQFWDIIDNTYIDDVTMAMSAGRPSIYDNDFYLSATHPHALIDSSVTDQQRIVRAMMHILIQCPRLAVTIRHALQDPSNHVACAAAFTHAENLWELTQENHFVRYIENSMARDTTFKIDTDVADILLHGVRFRAAQDMVISTRYWLLQVMLCGTIDTLYRRFPVEYAFSLLPEPESLRKADTSAAMQLGRAMLSLGTRPSPLTVVRMHGPLSGSIGAWHREIRYLASHRTVFDQIDAERISAAERMKKWLMKTCNVIMKSLNISQVDESAWLEALDSMAGEELPDWIPSKVSYGTEDGDLVMKLEYSDRTENGDLRVHGAGTTRVFNVREPAKFGPQHLRDWIRGVGGPSPT